MKPISAFKVLLGIPVLFCLILVLSSCKTRKTKQLKGTEISEREMKKNELVFEVTGYPMPTAFYVTSLLEEAEAPYYFSIPNAAKNVDHYFSQADKALNLGIFGADLCYAVTYMKTQEILQYLNASKRLYDEILIHTTFQESCCQRVEANLNHEDSLITIISDSFYDTYNYLTRNQKDKVAILIMAGSWIESLYITSQISLSLTKNKKIIEILEEQETSLRKLLEIMEPVKEDKEVVEIHRSLSELQNLYISYKSNKSNESFEKLIESIRFLRNKII